MDAHARFVLLDIRFNRRVPFSIAIFVEVKTSRSIDQAIIRISESQQRRIVNAAQIWLSKHAFGPRYLFRFDAIFVGDGGQLKHIEGAWTV